MISRADTKLIRKLKQKKYRWEHKLFIAEGVKVVREFMEEGLLPRFLLKTPEATSGSKDFEPAEVTKAEMKEFSSLATAPGLLGVFPFPVFKASADDFVLVLDEINDPGNLGTIIRTADWFGVKKIIAVEGTVDCYNPKVVQSTMGSLARVEVVYLTREETLDRLKAHRLLGADMEGSNIREFTSASVKNALIMGSESHGYNSFWDTHVEKITIPRAVNSRTESLNVAVATSVLLAFLRS